MVIGTKKSCLKHSRGFTLVEGLVAAVVLAVAMAGVLLPFAAGTTVQQEGARRALAVSLASDLIEEILASDYDAIIADYNNYTETPGQIKKAHGVFFNQDMYEGFYRQVAIEASANPKIDLLKVTVEVYYEGDILTSQTCLVSR